MKKLLFVVMGFLIIFTNINVFGAEPTSICKIEEYKEGFLFDHWISTESSYSYRGSDKQFSMEKCVENARYALSRPEVDEVIMTFESLFPTKIQAEISFKE